MWAMSWFLATVLCIGKSCGSAISDQLQQRLELVNTTDKYLAKEYLENKFPFLKSDCITEALKDFLPVCLEKGLDSVDSAVRVEAAVKLSICEFRASGLDHIPNSCDSWDVDSMMDCMIQLESSTQWWTTYSGNYQRLSSICFENSLPYEKRQILDLFLNVTSMYNDISEALRVQLHEIIKDSESASKEHSENMASMFQDYMDDFKRKVKSHEEDIEGSFIDHEAEMRNLMTRNSAAFAEELRKKDTQLMGSFDNILNSTGKIEYELSRLDISTEINDRNKAALERWTEVDEIFDKMHDTQIETQVRMGKQWQEFIALARGDILGMSSDLAESQTRAFEILNGYDDMVKEIILPSIAESVLSPLHTLKQQILFDWQETADLVTRDVMNWNNEVANSFEAISKNLNNTMEKVIDLDNGISKLYNFLTHIQSLIGIALKAFQCTWMVLFYAITNRLFWVLAVLLFCVSKVLKVLYSEKLLMLMLNATQKVLKWCVIFIMIFIGSKVGTLIVSKNS